MADDFQHLLRLAAAQLALARMKESRLQSERHRLSDLRRQRLGLMEAIERATAGVVIYSAVVRRVIELDSAIRSSDRRLGELVDDVISARSRHEVLMRRARGARLEKARSDAEAETLELVQNMRRNAPGKDSMMD